MAVFRFPVDIDRSKPDLAELVNGKEDSLNRYINGILVVSAIFLLIAYIRKLNLK